MDLRQLVELLLLLGHPAVVQHLCILHAQPSHQQHQYECKASQLPRNSSQ